MCSRRWFVACAALALLGGCGSLGTTTDTGSPQLAIITPDNGATVPREVLIEAQAFDDVGVDKVRFLIDGTLLTEIFTAPYLVTWNNSAFPNGSTHTIRAEAVDFAKNSTVQEITVTIGTTHGAP